MYICYYMQYIIQIMNIIPETSETAQKTTVFFSIITHRRDINYLKLLLIFLNKRGIMVENGIIAYVTEIAIPDINGYIAL